MRSRVTDTHTAVIRTVPSAAWLVAVCMAAIGASLSTAAAQTPGVHPASRSPSSARSGITMDYEGFTEPKFDILVAATEIGRLAEVNVKVGDRVTAGQVVARLEDGLQREAVATAELRAAMRGELEATAAETLFAKTRLDQLQELAKKNMARPDEVKRARADWEIARSRELAAKEQMSLRQQELSRYRLQLERRKIHAPMDGAVAEIFHAAGEYITPADPAVVRLLVVDQIYGVFNVPADEIAGMRVGAAASVFLATAGESVTGKIDSVAPDIDGESGTIKVKVLLDNSGRRYRVGDRCRMKLAPETAARSIPRRARIAPATSGQEMRRSAGGVRGIR